MDRLASIPIQPTVILQILLNLKLKGLNVQEERKDQSVHMVINIDVNMYYHLNKSMQENMVNNLC
jgi:hypothetical protein